MKYILGFVRFWRNFIIGDDPTIALTVIWSFVAVYSCIRSNIQAWYIVPLVITVLFIILFTKSLRTFAAQHKDYTPPTLSSFHSIDALWMPMVAVVILPFAMFRLASFDFSFERLFLPLAVCSCIIAGVTLLLAPRFKTYPALSTAGAVAVCLMLFRVVEAPMLLFFGIVTEHFFIGNIAMLVIAILILAELIRQIIRKREVTA